MTRDELNALEHERSVLRELLQEIEVQLLRTDNDDVALLLTEEMGDLEEQIDEITNKIVYRDSSY